MTITTGDVPTILGMVARGDKKHHIAAWYGENPARIAEVEDGQLGLPPIAPAHMLPPKGSPGLKGRKLKAFVEKALAALNANDVLSAKKALEDGLQRFNSHEST